MTRRLSPVSRTHILLYGVRKEMPVLRALRDEKTRRLDQLGSTALYPHLLLSEGVNMLDSSGNAIYSLVKAENGGGG